MAARFRSRLQGRQSSPRHRPGWSPGPSGSIVASGSSTVLFAVGSQSQLDEVTIVRTRGYFHAHLTTTVAGVNEGFDGAVGICVVSENAFNAGVASVPAPLDDIAWDGWLWYHFFDLKAVTSTLSDGVNANAVSQRIEIDSKAMRKTNITDVEIAVIQHVESGTASFGAELFTRSLSKIMT